LLVNVLGGVAEFEHELIRERTMAGRSRKARDRGVMPAGCRIFGYRLITKAHATVLPEYHGRDGELEVVDAEAQLVLELFERCASGQSIRSLADWMNGTGAHPPVGRRFARSCLHHMLRNTAYVGRGCDSRVRQVHAAACRA